MIIHSSSYACNYFLKMLVIFSLPPFYTDHVHLPCEDDLTPSRIFNNSKFYPLFENMLGAIDGTYINCCPPAADHKASCDHKGHLTQNCLVICYFNMAFCDVFSEWDGSTTDPTMFQDAHHRPSCSEMQILPSWCRLSNLWHPSYSVLKCLIPPCRVGQSQSPVRDTYLH